MIKRSYVFIALGIGIIAFHRKMDAISIPVDALIFVIGLGLIAFGLYLLNKERKNKPEADDF